MAFSVSPWGTTRARWVGCDEANAAMDASLFVLSRRPATPATLAAARQLWPLLGESGPIDTTFVDRMTIASMCALVELDERDVPSTAAGPDPVRPMCEGLASFAALQGLTRFSPSRIRSSPSSASERVSAASYDAFGAAATMRALAAVVAGELRTVTEAANRPDDDACASSAWLLVADAARAALRDWHREAVAPSAPETNAFGDDERDQKSPSSDARAHYRRLVREARRAAIDLVRVTAAASLPRGDHTADGHAVVAILSDVAEDESEDGVAALDALAAWALAETPAGVSKRGDLPPSVVRLVAQSGRAAMCSRSEAARDAGAACLWAVLRVGEPGETNALLSDDDEEDGTDRAVDDPDDYEITFEDGSGNWEASLFEDWLSDVDPAVSNAVPKRARGSDETRFPRWRDACVSRRRWRVSPLAPSNRKSRGPRKPPDGSSATRCPPERRRTFRASSLPARWRRSARSSTPARPDGWMPPSSPARARRARRRAARTPRRSATSEAFGS